MSYLQSAFIFISKPFAAINTEKSRKVRDVICALLALIFFAMFATSSLNSGIFENDLGEYSFLPGLFLGFSSMQRYIIGAVLLVLMAFLGVEKDAGKVQWNWLVGYLWFFLAVLVIISAYFHTIGDLMIGPVIIMLVLPFVFWAWQSSEAMDRFYTAISWALVIVALIFGLMCILEYPMSDETIMTGSSRYRAFFINPNGLGLFAVAGAVGAVYLCTCCKKLLVIIPAAALGICMQLTWLSRSRSALLALLAVLVVGLLLYIKNGNSIKRLLLFILIGAIMCSASWGLIKRDAGDMNSEEAFLPIPFATVVKAAAEDSNTVDRLTGSDGEEFTSGRIYIWEEYKKFLNLAGNDIDYYLPIRCIEPEHGYSMYYTAAHNITIEYAFRSGIPAGVVFALIQLIGLAYIFMRLVWKRKALKTEDIFACTAILAYVIVGLVESVHGEMTMMFLLASGMLFTFGIKADKDNIKKDEIE